ncbi:retrovirus-related pol polyprotein from transposon TNT 1-94 [Tanacetum coccineum]
MLLAMKDEAGSNLSNEENDFMLDSNQLMRILRLYNPMMQRLLARNDKDTIDRLVKEKEKIQNDFLKVENEKIIIQHETKLEKKAFKEREDRYLDDILDLEEKLSSHDRIVYKMGQSIQTIHMLGKKPNKVYDPFLKAGLGYTNPERLKKAIVAQPKMYDGDLLHSNKLVIHSTDSEETLEDAEESQNKMRHKMVQIDYEKLNALYETFVPQQELSAEQTYFSIPSTSDNGSKSKDVPSESTEQQKHELLKVKLEKSASDSRDIQANLLKRIKILENDFQRSQAQSIDFELKLQHQKEKMDCDVSWKAKLSTFHDENVLLKHQVESTIKERENIKLEFQKLFNSIKATRAQHQNEIYEMFEDVTQKTYAYADVRAQNQDLLMTIFELKNKLKTIDKGKHVNTKFDKSDTLGKLLCVTPFNINLAIKATNVSNTKVTSDRSKPVTSQSTPTIEKKQQHNANVIARGMYKINQEDIETKQSKANIIVSNSTGVGCSNSVRRPKSKDNKSKNNVLKNTKSSSTYVLKTTNSVCLDSNKCETKPSNVCQTNACITSSKTVNAVNDGLNIVCISFGLDVFLHSHEKCVTRNALTRKSSVKRALFTSPVATKSKSLGATSIVAKSRFSVAKTPTATNKVSSVSPLSQKSSQSRILSSYMNNKIATSRKWQKWFKYQQGFSWTPKSKTAKSQSNVHRYRTSVIQLILWIVNSGCSKHMTGNLQLLRNFFEKFMGTVRFGNDHVATITGYGYYVQGNLTICHVYYVEGLGHNLFSVGQFCDRDLEVAFRSNTCYVRILKGDDLLTGSQDSNIYTISISEMAASSPVCLMSIATSTKSWLWHRRLSHLNFDTINQLTSHDLVDGLPKFKYRKNHLCSACEQGKSKKASLSPKLVPSTESKHELLHMDLCEPMRVTSINGKKYILVIVDDYSRYTWVYFLRTKDEASNMIIDFVNQVQRNLKASILMIRTYNGTEFKNEKLRKSNVQYFHVFGSLCYPTNDRDDLGKMKSKADIGIFVGYSESSRGFRIYNRRNKKIMETIHVKFDKLTAMASECNNLELGMNCANFNDSSEDSRSVPSTSDLDNLFGPMYEEYYVSSSKEVSDNSATNTLDNDHTSSSSSIVIDQDDAPPIVSSLEEQIATESNSPVLNEVADEFVQEDVDPSNMHQFYQQHRSIDKWTKNHPLKQVIGDPSKPVMTRKRLQTDAEVIQLVLWIVDSGCSKHMTGNLQLLRNFVEKFMGTVCFGNDHFATIISYRDYVKGNLTICHVYYVKGLGHNLFSVGQLCDGDLEVAFRSNMCYVQNLEGDDLLMGSRDLNLYTISIPRWQLLLQCA